MIVDVVLHPRFLTSAHLANRVVVVFDVLRATTTMIAALSADAREIRAFDSIEAARTAAAAFDGPKLLCGEERTLPPAGFDLGNSPGDYTPLRVRERIIFFTTTNGTRAINAALAACERPLAVYAAALVNAGAMADELHRVNADVTLLCSGSDGQFSAEDFLGAGAVLNHLSSRCVIIPATDSVLAAQFAFLGARSDLRAALRQTHGGKNNLRVGLDADVDFAARLDVFKTIAKIEGSPPVARRVDSSF